MVPDLHLPLSPSKRPWWRITAKVRKEERGHGEVHDRKEKRYCELPLSLFYVALPNYANLAEHQIIMCFPRSLKMSLLKNDDLLFHEAIPVKWKIDVEYILKFSLSLPPKKPP